MNSSEKNDQCINELYAEVNKGGNSGQRRGRGGDGVGGWGRAHQILINSVKCGRIGLIGEINK